MSKIHIKFLKMAGFSEEEILLYLPRWMKTAKKIGLTQKDVRFAVEKWIPVYFDIALFGIRKCIGAFIRELISVCETNQYKEQGIKLIYGIMPAIPMNYQAIKMVGNDRVFVGFPDIILLTVMGAFFNKKVTNLGENEGKVFQKSCRHCALNKTRLNASTKGIISTPDIMWNWGFYCNEAPKTDELICNHFDPNWNYISVHVPHDSYLGEIEDENLERVQYMAAQLRHSQQEIAEITGFEVSENILNKAIENNMQYARKLDYLANIVMKADPQPLSAQVLDLFGLMLAVPFNTGTEYMEGALDTVTEEVEQMIARGEGILPKGAPKLGCYFAPWCVPWIAELFRENNVNLCVSTFFMMTEKQLMKSEFTDPYMCIAQKWFQNPNRVNMEYQAELLVQILNKYKFDAMLFGFFSFDRWEGTQQKMIANMVEQKINIPHFYMEGDFWEMENYDMDGRRSRVENICHFLKLSLMRKHKED